MEKKEKKASAEIDNWEFIVPHWPLKFFSEHDVKDTNFLPVPRHIVIAQISGGAPQNIFYQ